MPHKNLKNIRKHESDKNPCYAMYRFLVALCVSSHNLPFPLTLSVCVNVLEATLFNGIGILLYV